MLGHKASTWEVQTGMPDPSNPSRISWGTWETFDNKPEAFGELEDRILHYMDVYHGRRFSTLKERAAILKEYDGPPMQVLHVSHSIMWAVGKVPAE